MNCTRWQDKIDAFVDSELSPDEALGFEEHLRSCPACTQETLARQKLKIETRLAGQRFAPSAGFERRIRKQVAPERRPLFTWIPLLATAAALVLLAIFVVPKWREHSQWQAVVAQLVDQHVTTLASDHPVDVVSTDAHTVKPWFGGKVPFSVDVPDLAGTAFDLVGGKLVYLQQTPAAQLVFGIRKHRVSVFMFRDGPDAAALGNDTAPVRRNGFNTQTWVEDGVRYFAISDVDPRAVAELCNLLKKSS